MATFVLVHGGWGGGWEWRLIANRLAQAGHAVFRPTLTGLGERRHLARPDVNLSTHAADVIGLIEFEDLHPLATLDEQVQLSGAGDAIPRSYVSCRPPEATNWTFEPFHARAISDGWDAHDLPVGHDAHVLAPDQLSALLMRVADVGAR